MDMKDIEALAQTHAADRAALTAVVTRMQRELQEVKDKHIQAIRESIVEIAISGGRLRQAIEDSKDLFTKPRTRILHGLRIGYMKGKGKIRVMDEANAVGIIQRDYHDDFEVLVKTRRSLVLSAIAKLPARELKRMGITIEDAGDEIVIKPVDGEVDKIVNALLKEADKEAA